MKKQTFRFAVVATLAFPCAALGAGLGGSIGGGVSIGGGTPGVAVGGMSTGIGAGAAGTGLRVEGGANAGVRPGSVQTSSGARTNLTTSSDVVVEQPRKRASVGASADVKANAAVEAK